MKRIDVLDLWRSLAVFVMIAYHAVYDLSLFGVAGGEFIDSAFGRTVDIIGAGSFIVISGMVAPYSRSGVRRGFVVFCAGLAVAVVTTLVGMPVKFGILQCLGVCMMLSGAMREKLVKWRASPLFPAACVLLFAVTAVVSAKYTVDKKYLYPLGLKHPGFYSADYYPLFPWIFLFLFGTWLSYLVDSHREAPLWNVRLPRALTFAGRHSLAIYLLHQPVLYGLCYVFFGRGQI